MSYIAFVFRKISLKYEISRFIFALSFEKAVFRSLVFTLIINTGTERTSITRAKIIFSLAIRINAAANETSVSNE